MLRFDGIHSTKEFGVVAVAGGGQDVVSDNVPDGTPREDVYDVEADGVVRLEEADVLLGPGVAGLEVGQPVLLRQPLLRHVLPLEVEEYEPPQEQRQPRAQADHHRRVQLRPDCSPPAPAVQLLRPQRGESGGPEAAAGSRHLQQGQG
ncbi:hypothetical protein Dimus_001008 [Dionaea muscipula]